MSNKVQDLKERGIWTWVVAVDRATPIPTKIHVRRVCVMPTQVFEKGDILVGVNELVDPDVPLGAVVFKLEPHIVLLDGWFNSHADAVEGMREIVEAEDHDDVSWGVEITDTAPEEEEGDCADDNSSFTGTPIQ